MGEQVTNDRRDDDTNSVAPDVTYDAAGEYRQAYRGPQYYLGRHRFVFLDGLKDRGTTTKPRILLGYSIPQNPDTGNPQRPGAGQLPLFCGVRMAAEQRPVSTRN
jgi:hypothetical protein